MGARCRSQFHTPSELRSSGLCRFCRGGGPVFRIRKKETGDDDCGGHAFSPNSVKTLQTNFLILDLFASDGVSGCNNVPGLRKTILHEMGHILGLGHEMLPNTSGMGCPENGVPLDDRFETGPYDTYSIMMYEQYGPNAGGLELTRLDARGVRYMYGLPRSLDTDYNGDELSDIFFYSSTGNPGSSQILFGGDSLDLQASPASPLGGVQKPVAADFSGDGLTDLLLFSPIETDIADEYFRRTPNGDFDVFETVEDISPRDVPSLGRFYAEFSSPQVQWGQALYLGYEPTRPLVVEIPSPGGIFDSHDRDSFDVFVGDFDGNGRDDIAHIDVSDRTDPDSDKGRWYKNSAAELTWSYSLLSLEGKQLPGDPPHQYIHTSVADFDGDGMSDILWYVPDEDVVVWFGGVDGPGTSVATYDNPGPGERFRAFSYDLQGLGRDQIYWTAQTETEDVLWTFGDDRSIELSTTITYNNPEHREMIPIPGNFRANGDGLSGPRGEIYWWNAVGESELWELVGPQSFQSEVAPSGQGFPVGYALR